VSEQSHGLADALLYAVSDCLRANGTEQVRVAHGRRECVLLGFLCDREPVIIADLELSENGLSMFGLETTKSLSR